MISVTFKRTQNNLRIMNACVKIETDLHSPRRVGLSPSWPATVVVLTLRRRLGHRRGPSMESAPLLRSTSSGAEAGHWMEESMLTV